MSDDIIQKAIKSGDTAKFNSAVGGVIVTAVLFFLPVGLFYMFIYFKSQVAFIDGVYLFFSIYIVGALASLMYYRFVVMDDDEIKIDLMSLGTVSAVFGKCFLAFFGILGFTMIALALNPSLIRIFENTVGFAVCRSYGVNDLLNKMLKSEIFSKLSNGMAEKDKEDYMNYDFLLTTWNLSDKEKLEETIRAACKDTSSAATKRDLKFDFYWNTKLITEEKLKELMDFIDLKYYVGHFTWIYIASTFSLLVSIVTTVMN